MENLLYIFDLEGTLTCSEWRYEYYRQKMYDKYNEGFILDGPNEGTVKMCNQIAMSGRQVIILTAMEELFRKEALAWLIRNDVKYTDLFMKPTGSEKTSVEFKQHFILGENAPNVALAVDDREDVIEMYRKNNIPALFVRRK